MHKNPIFILIAILTSSSCASGQVQFLEKEDRIDVMYQEKVITSYQIGKDMLKPSLFPIKATDGEIVTRQFPFEEIEGESTDHPHHTGLFFTYGSKNEVNGNSFWNLHDIPPGIQHIKVLEKKEKAENGSISTISHWIDKNGKAILEESRTMTFNFQRKNSYSIDFEVFLKALETDVIFQDTKEGMFAVRVADWMSEESKGMIIGTGKYTNAQGLTNEENIWGRQSEWVKLEGTKGEKVYGLAIFYHPESVNFPTYWHARGYGCFAANPIGQFGFQKEYLEAPKKRNLEIQKGKSAAFGFRVLIYEDSKEHKELQAEYESFKLSDL
ncbi:MAG: PmoA family protein [Cyclobacteriaceae bacterium]